MLAPRRQLGRDHREWITLDLAGGGRTRSALRCVWRADRKGVRAGQARAEDVDEWREVECLARGRDPRTGPPRSAYERVHPVDRARCQRGADVAIGALICHRADGAYAVYHWHSGRVAVQDTRGCQQVACFVDNLESNDVGRGKVAGDVGKEVGGAVDVEADAAV